MISRSFSKLRPRRLPRARSAWLLVALLLSCVRPGPQPRTPEARAPELPVREPGPAPEPVEPLSPPGLRPPVGPVRVRVGLATDLEQVVLPCCDGEITAEIGEESLALVSPLRVEPVAELAGRAVYRLQIAALREEQEAAALAERLTSLAGESADARFDAAAGLYRVRIGRYPTREAAEAAQRGLESRGLRGSWIAGEGGGLVDPALSVTHRGHTVRVPGRWLAIEAPPQGGIRLEGGRYRGRILVYLNDRGMLNLINELFLEDYLRGVVPKEMGPGAYPELESLKAQAVAARTYLLRNRGGFTEEGFDICATPRCQVYQGMESEHPLSDRAVAETAGEVVLYDGLLADTLYSSTCGGHTENVEVVFPQRAPEPFLRGVPCVEAGTMPVAGSLRQGTPFPEGLMRGFLPPPTQGDPVAIGASRLAQLAVLADLPVPRDRLRSLARREVNRFIASLFDLALDARLFVRPEELAYLLEDPPPGWSEEDRRLAGYLVKTGLSVGALDRDLRPEELEETLFQLALYLGVLEESEARFLALRGQEIRVAEDGEIRDLKGPPLLAAFRRQGARIAAADLRLVAGDRVFLYRVRGELLGVVQEIDPQGGLYDRESRWSSWQRYRSWAQVSEGVATRFPGLEVRDLEVVSRGVSGRVGALRVVGRDGREEIVEGLPIRWMLGLPDTLFTFQRVRYGARAGGWVFHGRGLGHGVGMCQVGAYGMAQRGHDYREILAHYYRGTVLGKIRNAGS